MSIAPENAVQISLDGATVPFYKYEENDTEFVLFDSSRCGHPEPMINAMTGLQNLADGQKLVMINSKAPMGLFPKIEQDYDYEVENLEDGRAKIVFTKKADAKGETNFGDTACGGGSCQN